VVQVAETAPDLLMGKDGSKLCYAEKFSCVHYRFQSSQINASPYMKFSSRTRTERGYVLILVIQRKIHNT
jgi:hypothetical protein